MFNVIGHFACEIFDVTVEGGEKLFHRSYNRVVETNQAAGAELSRSRRFFNEKIRGQGLTGHQSGCITVRTSYFFDEAPSVCLRLIRLETVQSA